MRHTNLTPDEELNSLIISETFFVSTYTGVTNFEKQSDFLPTLYMSTMEPCLGCPKNCPCNGFVNTERKYRYEIDVKEASLEADKPLMTIIKTKPESVSLSCKSHHSKTTNIRILFANSNHRR